MVHGRLVEQLKWVVSGLDQLNPQTKLEGPTKTRIPPDLTTRHKFNKCQQTRSKFANKLDLN